MANFCKLISFQNQKDEGERPHLQVEVHVVATSDVLLTWPRDGRQARHNPRHARGVLHAGGAPEHGWGHPGIRDHH